MFNINKEERELLEKTGCWSFWDTIFGQYADTTIAIIALFLVVMLGWAEVEYEVLTSFWNNMSF